jgi:hypothetical protein
MGNRFYVYELSDPRTGVTFYVGKGCGNRAHHHVAEVRCGRVKNAHKHKVISDIIAAGLSPVVTIISERLNEQEAFSLERDRIRFYGFRQLTNIQPGTLTSIDRSKVEAQIDLSKLKSHDQWLSEKPRSEFEIALALKVRAELAHIAVHGQVTEVTISKQGVRFR